MEQVCGMVCPFAGSVALSIKVNKELQGVCEEFKKFKEFKEFKTLVFVLRNLS